MSAPSGSATQTSYQGNDKLLAGLVLSIVSYWLFAISLGTVAPAVLLDLNGPYTDPAAGTWASTVMSPTAMNLAVALTGLVSGLFIVLMGGFADKFGRVRLTIIGNLLNIVGCVLIVLATGALASPLMIGGRAIQGLSAACVMPATIALVKTYWDGPARQRAVSMWSIGSFGGAGLAAFVGGLTATEMNWRWIFVFSMIVSVVAVLLVWGTPESRVTEPGRHGFDVRGLVVFLITVLAMMMLLTFAGKTFDWFSPIGLILIIVTIVGIAAFIAVERNKEHAFIDFALFKNTTFTGATLSNFLINGTIGMLIISQQVIQLAGCKVERDAAGHCPAGGLYSAWDAGLLTLGYGVFIIAFIRVGEKLLQKFGPRKPMIWGSLIVGAAILCLMPTHMLLDTYRIFAIIGFSLFGLGLAFYATPSTDAALANLPADQAGSGAGIYKMASSLGGAIGTAISLAVFTGLSGADYQMLGNVIEMQGAQTNVSLRLAGMAALGVNLVFLLLAIISITVTVPKQTGPITPTPQPTPDAIAEAGFVECPTCHGEGYVKRSDLAGSSAG